MGCDKSFPSSLADSQCWSGAAESAQNAASKLWESAWGGKKEEYISVYGKNAVDPEETAKPGAKGKAAAADGSAPAEKSQTNVSKLLQGLGVDDTPRPNSSGTDNARPLTHFGGSTGSKFTETPVAGDSGAVSRPRIGGLNKDFGQIDVDAIAAGAAAPEKSKLAPMVGRSVNSEPAVAAPAADPNEGQVGKRAPVPRIQPMPDASNNEALRQRLEKLQEEQSKSIAAQREHRKQGSPMIYVPNDLERPHRKM